MEHTHFYWSLIEFSRVFVGSHTISTVWVQVVFIWSACHCWLSPLLCCPVWYNVSFMNIVLLMPSKTIPKICRKSISGTVSLLCFFLGFHRAGVSESTLWNTTKNDDDCWEQRWTSHSSAKFHNTNSAASRCFKWDRIQVSWRIRRKRGSTVTSWSISRLVDMHTGLRRTRTCPAISTSCTRRDRTWGHTSHQRDRFGGHWWTLASIRVHATSVKKCAQRNPEHLLSSQCLMLDGLQWRKCHEFAQDDGNYHPGSHNGSSIHDVGLSSTCHILTDKRQARDVSHLSVSKEKIINASLRRWCCTGRRDKGRATRRMSTRREDQFVRDMTEWVDHRWVGMTFWDKTHYVG